jgi:hypothetical protein
MLRTNVLKAFSELSQKLLNEAIADDPKENKYIW